ncbi:Alpha/Beta hydrolase protein [Diplogelasinospora grovesii]|uniref:Alpha/Beta hydrolase protein n=1 Tax=Diplogelasinospora grovesii TaxID=303347 RepID=A0AAN6S478_9PEZI|nr:Alpha/Beta hydrolase protein [Diplogelasinospora grovesii]
MDECEKQPLLLRDEPPPRQRDTDGGSYPWKFVLGLMGLFALLSWHHAMHSDSFERHNRKDDDGGYCRTYAGEHIEWKACGQIGPDHRELECSSIDVPMDQFNATNSGSKTFGIPLIRMRAKGASRDDTATQNMLLNPGGPGGSGLEFMYRRGVQLSTIVGEDKFHLLSFDPRGINQSQPLASCYPTPEARRELSSDVRNKKIVEDSGELWAWTANFVQACADTMGEHGKYINTPQTAADMNSILDAVGQEDMVYWGFSYGTLLGQTYATLFPERSKRVIIDGVANQFDWYESPLDLEEMADTDSVFWGFLDECIKAGPGNCTLAPLANTTQELFDKVVTFVEEMRDDPLSVYVNNTVYGVLDYWAVWYNGIFPALYKPANWYTLASNLASMLQGNATDAFLAYGRDAAWDIPSDAENVVSLNDGASGPQHWPEQQDRKSLVDKLVPHFNQSLFGASEYDHYFAKRAWAIPKTHGYVPRRGVQTAHPLLILSTTYDPVCPLISARSANAAFGGSRLVEVKGYGHCSLAVASMCIVRHVRTFLYEGKLPDGNTQCEVDGPYFIKPEEGSKTVSTVQFVDQEEQRIHLAQLELARDLWFKPW